MASSSVSRTCAWLCMACWQQTWPGGGDCHSGAFTTRAPDTALTVTLLLRAEADGMALCPPGRCGGRRRRLVRQSTSPSAPSRKLHRHMQRMTVRASITSRIHPDLQRMTPSACAFRNLLHILESDCAVFCWSRHPPVHSHKPPPRRMPADRAGVLRPHLRERRRFPRTFVPASTPTCFPPAHLLDRPGCSFPQP